MGLRQLLSKIPIVKYFVPSDNVMEKSYDWVKYFGNFGFSALSTLMVIYIPLMIANDLEKQSLHKIVSASYGVKLENRNSYPPSQSSNVNVL